jgi:mRNA degradation ribonuclease J1/J2
MNNELFKKEDLKIFSSDEILNMLAELVSRMESKGNRYMDYYNNSDNKEFDIDKHTCAAGLLTEVNFIKHQINFIKNQK